MIPQRWFTLPSLLLTLLFAVLLLCAVQPAAAFAQDTPDALGSISGTVRNQQGDALPGISVYLEHYTNAYAGQSVYTNAQGDYHFLSVAPGLYRLAFSDPKAIYPNTYYPDGVFADEATLLTVQGNAVTGIEMTLAHGGSLAVEIDAPVPLTDTTTTNVSGVLARQNQSGRWERYGSPNWDVANERLLFSALPSGDYQLCVTIWFQYYSQQIAECYDNKLPVAPGDIADDAEAIAVANDITTTVTMTVGDIHQVAGVLQNPQGEPIANGLVQLRGTGGSSGQWSTSDAEGHFQFYYLFAGEYWITFRAAGYLSTYYNQVSEYQQATPLKIGANSRVELTIPMQPSLYITGKVLWLGGGPAHPNSWLERYVPESDSWKQYLPYCLEPECMEFAYAPDTGAYTVTNLVAGNYRLGMAVQVGGVSQSYVESIDLTAGESRSNVDYIFGAGVFDGKITGKVTANGLPQAGIEVGLFNTQGQVTMPLVFTLTDAQGNYELNGLARGTYQIGFHDPLGRYATTFFDGGQFYTDATGVVISDTLTIANINGALTPGATLRGHVHSDDRRSAAGFQITLHATYPYAAEAFINVLTDKEGYYEVTGLPPGSYWVLATKPYGVSITDPYLYRSYYPGRSDAPFATKVAVGEGQVVEGIDIWFDATPGALLPMISVRGK